MRSLVATYGLDAGRAVVVERTFLRWDREWSLAQRPAGYDGTVAADELVRAFWRCARRRPRPGSARTGGGRSARWRCATASMLDVGAQRAPADRVLALPERRSPQRLQPRCPHRTVHRDPRRGAARRPGGPRRAGRWRAPTSTCRRSRAPAAPGWSPRPGSGGASSPGRTRCSTATTVLRAAGVELIWVDLAGT